MSAAAKAGIKAIRLIRKVVDILILVIIMLFIAADFYAAWDSKQAYEWAESAHYTVYKPTAQNEGLSFKELQDINPEVFGWLTVYGTHIDYPVVQGSDNIKYVNTNALGKYSLSGAIFLDARCKKDFSDFSSILYGHHMQRNAMFGEIGSFVDKEFFTARQYGMLYYDGQEHGLEFFAFLRCDAYDAEVFRTNIGGREAQEAYVDLLLGIAIHTRNIKVAADDRIVLLSTCSSSTTNARDILVGKITDEVYEDTFKTTETGNALTVDRQLSSGWIILLIALILLLIWLLFLREKERKKKREDEDNELPVDRGDNG